MLDLITLAIGLAVASVVGLIFLALAISIPIVGLRALQVFVGREWIPLVYNLRSLARRKTMTSLTFGAFALVVFVLTEIGMLAAGISHTLETTGDPLHAKVVRKSASSEWISWISEVQVQQLGSAPGIALNEAGMPLISGEMVVVVWAPRAGGEDPDDGANLSVRGLHPIGFELHPVRLLQGRLFEAGTQEVIIGRALVGRYAGAELGGTMTFAEHSWKVVGIVDHGGTAHDSEVWGDIEMLSPVFRRQYSSATLALRDRGSLEELSLALASNPEQSDLLVKAEPEYWKGLSGNYVGFITLVGGVVGLVFSFGAVLGALNTMYAQVTARTRELGTLRAIGFKPRAILVALVLESVSLAFVAGVVGVLLASFSSSMTFRLTSVQSLSEVTYALHLGPDVAVLTLLLSLLMGYAGGLLPAVHAARMPIVHAVRAD